MEKCYLLTVGWGSRNIVLGLSKRMKLSNAAYIQAQDIKTVLMLTSCLSL